MKVFIITEGGVKMGFGHITRCISLYEAFEEIKIPVEFIINGDEAIEILLNGKNHKIINWPKEKDKLFSLIKEAAIVVIDSYIADLEFYKKTSDLASISVYIDDNNRIEYPNGIVVNSNIYAKEIGYPKRKNVIYLLGAKYALLRKEFWEVSPKRIKEHIGNIMITLGGTNIREATLTILKELTKSFPELTKNIIINYRDIEKFKNMEDEKTKLIFSIKANGIKKLMFEADVAISSSGQILYELARISVPTISIVTAKNQLKNAMSWQRAGFTKYVGCDNSKKVLDNIKKSLKLLEDKKIRVKMAEAGKRLIDGNGPRRILKEILKAKI